MTHNGFMHPHCPEKRTKIKQTRLIGRTSGLIARISGLAGRTGGTDR
ncbi:MAG: hypothetical protein KAR47_09915 [Planctomycetes bacterium]|nr:hypothetical protein [Planctomycetota bacterium]